ncbi:hypothetical protein [Azospirillum sp. SYSU D00513]|uniref:hypothetical protein n=1 Tax=Azospirillum sp. SYSU D00513 TaxID=2812561 RepID=UPI001A973515|nr:hypothetical protein [Azospirillum sp. SYSU D00513]
MRLRLWAAGLCLIASAILPAPLQAHDHWRGHRGDGPSFGEVRRACDWGNRRACVRMGQMIEQRRDAHREWRRERWREERRWNRERERYYRGW